MKKSTHILTILLAVVVLCITITACVSNMMDEIHFTLNTLQENFNPPRTTLIKTEEDFIQFIENKDIFADELSEEFQAINSQYNADFFAKNDLIAIIVQATSSMITGYELKEITKESSSWIVSIKSISSSENVTDDMGRYFSYYVMVEKDTAISTAQLKW